MTFIKKPDEERLSNAGRPYCYKPELCEKVIKMFKKGMSVEEICYYLNFSKDTFYRYIKENQEFSDAVNAGKQFSEGWWRIKGRKNISNKEFNSTLWYMNMKNRFGWKDKQESEVSETQNSLMQKLIDKL